MRYTDFQLELMPSWLREGLAEAYNRSLGREKDDFIAEIIEAIEISAISKADEKALYYIGQERLMPRYREESVESHRARLLDAWEFWKWAGTKRGIILAFEPAGYEAHVIELFKYGHQELWAEFTLNLKSNNQVPITDRWNDGTSWNDGTLWNYQLGEYEPDKITGILNRIKAAHSKAHHIHYFIANEVEYWGDGAVWNDGGSWETITTQGEEVQLVESKRIYSLRFGATHNSQYIPLIT